MENACLPSWFSCIECVIDTIDDGHLGEIERAYTIEARHIDGELTRVRTSLMMCVYSTTRTEEVLCRTGVKAIACQDIVALQDCDAAGARHDDRCGLHPAVGAGTAPNGIEAITECHHETDRPAVAPAAVDVCITLHVRKPFAP